MKNTEITRLLLKNKKLWQQFGSESDIAILNPNSDELFAIWVQKIKEEIIPNNNKIVKLLKQENIDSVIVEQFIAHTESYNDWNNNEIPYHYIKSYPKDFEKFWSNYEEYF